MGARAPPAAPAGDSAQLEEQAAMQRRRREADNRLVAQDVVLNLGHDPPARIGREADIPFRLEARRGLEKANMAFLDQIAHRQAEIAEFCRHGDHQTHMRGRYPVERFLIAAVFPSLRELGRLDLKGDVVVRIPLKEWLGLWLERTNQIVPPNPIGPIR